ncbi:N-acetylglucosamine-6-phosphate deacetylase [Leucobacter musarum]|uniref:N-acetylglucosamine-6-phosphate deacetylase n=1 Tax=Leucobacter musarum TaxID=1930747 RepID=UPI0006A7DE82|nr:amidohydrolase family protein [Leucobacter musarum]
MTSPDCLLTAARVVTGSAVHAPGWARVSGDRVIAVGSGVPDDDDARLLHRVDLGEATIVPGFVDIHVHGGGGSSYPDSGAGDGVTPAKRARAAHLAHGTTRSMASLVAATPERLLAQVAALAPLVADGELGGIHVEGPWLSAGRAGAHDPAVLRAPDSAEVADLLDAGRSGTDGRTAIAVVTIAPELPGAIAAIEQFVAAGVRVGIGHTDADAACTRRAIDAGATLATHLFNAMPPLHHRQPGPVLALMHDPRVTLELVADGIHLAPELARWVVASAGAQRVALVTDAMAAAGQGDGDYRLGGLDVAVRDGVARLRGETGGIGAIAGSTATMDRLFRSWILGDGDGDGDGDNDAADNASEPPSDARWSEAVRVTATTPARAVGWVDSGDLATGMRADLVVLDPAVRVQRVMRGGAWVADHPTT